MGYQKARGPLSHIPKGGIFPTSQDRLWLSAPKGLWFLMLDRAIKSEAAPPPPSSLTIFIDAVSASSIAPLS
jgi:hypothetical protein